MPIFKLNFTLRKKYTKLKISGDSRQHLEPAWGVESEYALRSPQGPPEGPPWGPKVELITKKKGN